MQLTIPQKITRTMFDLRALQKLGIKFLAACLETCLT